MTRTPPPLTDPELPALPVLLGPGAGDLLATVLAAVDARPLDLRLRQVRYVPGRSITAQYQVRVAWAEGGTTHETFVATSGEPPPDGTIVLEADGVAVAIWRYPDDPHLPGLAAAADPRRVARLLADLGVEGPEPRLRRRAYRPGRRAVVEATTPGARIFLKVVPPDVVDGLQARHAAMIGHVPVPRSHGWSKDLGIVVLEALPGKTLRKLLEGGTRRLPPAEALVELLDALPDPPGSSTPVPGPASRAPGHATLLAAILPEAAARIRAIVEAVAGVEPDPPVPVHGDFHATQILVRDSRVAGLLDVDTAGLGSRADDLATLLGQLTVLGLTRASRPNLARYTRALLADFDRRVDPVALRLRTAAAVLGLATGPFRVQEENWPLGVERRIAAAERWVEAARRLG